MKKKLLILTDGNNYLAPKLEYRGGTHHSSMIDLNKLVSLLEKECIVTCKKYEDIDLGNNYRNWYVVYAGSAERGLFYKNYIEDILLRLKEDGARLIPDYKYFRAFENKAFQEMLRMGFKDDELIHPLSQVIGRLDDFHIEKYNDFPYVVKMATGAQGRGVVITKTKKELKEAVIKLSKLSYHDYLHSMRRDFIYIGTIWELKKWVYRKLLRRWHPDRSPLGYKTTNKVIVQEYISGLSMHYAVVIYMNKFYVQCVGEKDADFHIIKRGAKEPDNDEVLRVLRFAKKVQNWIDVPMLAIDVGIKDKTCFLIEFDCLNFTTSVLQESSYYYKYIDEKNDFDRFDTKSDLEEETGEALLRFMDKMEKI